MEPQEGSNKGSLQSETDLRRDLAPPLGEKRWKVWSQSQSAWMLDQRVQVTEHVRCDSQHPVRRKKLRTWTAGRVAGFRDCIMHSLYCHKRVFDILKILIYSSREA